MQILTIIGGLVVALTITVGTWRCIKFICRGNPPASSGDEHEHGAGKTVSEGGGSDAAAE